LFDLRDSKPIQFKPDIRDTLFGDLPWASWPSVDTAKAPTTSEPWTSFAMAKQLLDSGDKNGTVETLRRILGKPGLESRHYLQA
jgi:hypothetical protein